jgi:hypothetical protein
MGPCCVLKLTHDHDSGCGIGVILRMMYVLVLVTSRMFRGSTQPIEDDVDEEETAVLLVAPPPEYIRDEKAGL